MKKFVSAAAVAVFAALPVLASAAEFGAGQEYASSPQQRITGGLYVVAGSASLAAPVSGDLFVGAGEVSVTGAVSGDIAVGGGTVQLLGPVAGDVRAVAGNVSLNNRINGDLVVLGGKVHILDGGIVDGGLYVAGGSVTIDGTVRGPVKMVGGRLVINGTVLDSINARLDDSLVIGPGGQVSGTIDYRAPKEASIASDAKVGGAVTYTASSRRHGSERTAKAAIFAVLGIVTAMKTLALLGLAALLVWRWRRAILEMLTEAYDRFWPSVGHGVVYAILVPIGGMLLLISVLGTLPGAILLMLYGTLMILAKVMTGLFIGAWCSKRMQKAPMLYLGWTSALGGILLMELLGLIPLVGWLIKTVIGLAVFGVLARRAQRMLS